MNIYLGGGEILLLRIGKYLSKYYNITIITSKDSYISKNIDFKCRFVTYGNGDYYYLNKKQKKDYINSIAKELSYNQNIKLITFCFRDLYTVIDLIKEVAFTPFHLLLHPLDHLYLSQSIFDKLKQKYGAQVFSKKHLLSINFSILERLNDNNLLISMNQNVSNRIAQDCNIQVKKMVALPAINTKKTIKINKQNNKKIVWLGRLVDFKIPAIYAMIDFLDKHEEYKFYIVGYGGEKKLTTYIDRKSNSKLKEQIKIIGKIDNHILIEELKKYDIGYGMGTSIIELVSAGLPTIVAIASPNYKSFNTEVSGGLCYEVEYGNVGDDLYGGKRIDELPKISNCMNKINYNYEAEAKKSIEGMKKMFSLEKNLIKIKAIIDSQSITYNLFKNIELPKMDWQKKLIRDTIKYAIFMS